MPEPQPILLIDGSSWLFRAFHALPPLTNSAGEPTGAVYGMGNMLRKLLREYQPERIAVIFDPPGKTFRNELYPEYKANRPPIPEELSSQFETMRELVTALGLKLIQVEGVEADDVIGTLIERWGGEKWPALIVTSDKDMAQLVNENVRLLDTMRDKVTDIDGVVEKFGVPPEQIRDWLALVGDTSDNIPGVHKVGPKTAAKWLQQYGDLDGVMEHASEIGGKVGEYLGQALDHLPMSRKLATIKCDVELGLEPEDLALATPDQKALAELTRRLEFRNWLDEFTKDEDEARTTEQVATASHQVLDEQALDDLIARLEGNELVCVDTETDSIDSIRARLVGLSFAVEPGEAWYVPVAHDDPDAPAQLSREYVLGKLKPLLENPDKPKVGQHLKYDWNVLANHDVHLAGIDHDTMLQSYILNSTATRHDMDSLAAKYLGHTTIKFADVAGKGAKQVTFDQVPLDQAAPYAAEDADITLRLHRALWPRIEKEERLAGLYRDVEIPLVPVLARMERNGVLVDTAFLDKLSREMAETQGELEEKAVREAGGPFNLNSPAQLQEILFDRLGLPVQRRTGKGQPSTAEDVLEKLADEHPLPALILEYRSVTKLRSTYAQRLPEQVNPDTGRVHTSYHQSVAATGRLSSSDPNLQNIPIRTQAGRRIREAFIAPPGRRLVSVDYSQIELRVMAHLSSDEGLTHAFRSGGDVHRATAAEIFDVPPERVSEEQRSAAKAINFGLMYGMSAFGLGRRLHLSRQEANRYIERFFERYAGVRRFMDDTRESAREKGFVETLWGRRLYLPDIKSRNAGRRQYAERTAINAPLQGTSADLIKRAMIDLHGWLETNHPEVRMIMQVHDELIFELPEEGWESLAREIAHRMCTAARLSVPLCADIGTGANWDKAHDKWDTVEA